jgi:tRNA (cytidine56-2'-O)-methyltransferase
MLFVLRLGHRRERDKRISTHVALVARAFGADGIIFSGEKDENLIESINKITEKWGGPFSVVYEKSWKTWLENFEGIKVHLTMYGIPFQKKMAEIKKNHKNMDVCVIVGSEKVPSEVYELADYNLAVGNQPQSEVSALAVFLYELMNRKLKEDFKNAKLKIVPQEKGKHVIRN